MLGHLEESPTDCIRNFPRHSIEACVEVLGAKILTTEQKITLWPQQSTAKILRELRLIAVLPCAIPIKEHLVGMKIMPQLNYATNINFVPKTVLKSIHGTITNILWNNRPIWRSRDLIFALFSNPHRSEPFVSRAYESILSTIDF